jgi:hypothetical protein
MSTVLVEGVRVRAVPENPPSSFKSPEPEKVIWQPVEQVPCASVPVTQIVPVDAVITAFRVVVVAVQVRPPVLN